MGDQRAAIGPKEKGKPKTKVNKSLLTVTLEAIKTLEETAAGQQEEHHVREMALQLGDLCREQNISLSKHELVQLANLRPHSAVDIQLLIENSEERLNDQQGPQIQRERMRKRLREVTQRLLPRRNVRKIRMEMKK